MMMPFSKSTVSLARLIPIVLIIAGTIMGSWYFGEKEIRSETDLLLLRAQNIAFSISGDSVKQLKGSLSDIGTPAYDDLKSKLINLHNINSDTRFVYLMGLHDDIQFFYMDSELPKSKDYSPPGQIYPDALPLDIENHRNGVSYSNGPYTDTWGTWISAYAPVKDRITGEVVAMLGVDAEADTILNKAWLVRINVLIMGAFLLVSVLFLVKVLQNSIHHRRTLEEKNQDLEIQKDYFEEAQILARLGQMNIHVPSGETLLNSFMSEILDVRLKSQITLSEFFKLIDPTDATRIQSQFSLLKDNDKERLSFTYHVPKADGSSTTVASLCKIKRDARNAPLHIVCTAQDISAHIS